MFGQLFGKYLNEQGVLDKETLDTVLKEQSKIRVKLGVIAVADKLITQEQADEINRIQAEEDKRFGDIAVEKGYLTEEQVGSLLAKQGNPYMQFLQVFVEKSKVKVSKIDGYLENFQKQLGLDDNEMEALKKDDFEALLSVYAFASKPYVTDIAGLVLRSINRLVTTDFYFDRIKSVDHLDYRCMVAQKSEGDTDICIGFATDCDNEALAIIASGYTGVECKGHSVEAYDGVGEFVNCISGLFATSLSNNGVDVEIKPQMAYENQSAKGGAYILPIHIHDQVVELYIAVDSNVNVGSMPLIRKMKAKDLSAVDSSNVGKGTVVIVDDSGMSRTMLNNLLTEAGFTVVAEACDGLEGVMAYKQYNPDIITLDITMPNMDGTEALKEIMDYDESAKAVMITAAGQQNKVIEALKIGAEKFITKPYEKEEVIATMEALLK